MLWDAPRFPVMPWDALGCYRNIIFWKYDSSVMFIVDYCKFL